MRAEMHVSDRVGVVVVLAGGIHDQIGFEFFQHGQDSVFKHIEKPFFGGPGRQGQIDRCSGGVWTAKILWKPGAGVQGASVLMHRYEERVGVVPVNVLSTVTMVAVGIDY